MSEELSSAPVNDGNSSALTKRPRIADSVSPTPEQRNSSLNIKGIPMAIVVRHVLLKES